MAVSVDTVYQTVLAIANKEQRGYITPQEFNLFANQAQNEIFEQYFYDLNQSRRVPGNETVISDPRDIVEEKISLFKVNATTPNAQVDNLGYVSLNNIANLHKLESVCVCYKNQPSSASYGYSASNSSDIYVVAEELNNASDLKRRMSSKLTSPSYKRPVFVRSGGTYGSLDIQPALDYQVDKVKIDYIRKPVPPNWTYVVINQNALFNPDGSAGWQDFEVHASEEKNLVVKILQMAGISIKDFELAQASSGKEVNMIQLEKA